MRYAQLRLLLVIALLGAPVLTVVAQSPLPSLALDPAGAPPSCAPAHGQPSYNPNNPNPCPSHPPAGSTPNPCASHAPAAFGANPCPSQSPAANPRPTPSHKPHAKLTPAGPPVVIGLPGGKASQAKFDAALAVTRGGAVRTVLPPAPSSQSNVRVNAATVSNIQVSPCIVVQNNHLIQTVNGASKSVTFAPGGAYHIVGCGFGASPGSVTLQGAFGGGMSMQFTFQITNWSDTAIDATLPNSISGVNDVANATLIVQPSGTGSLQQAGDSFVAARSSVLLNHILPSWFTSRRDPYGPVQFTTSSQGVENGRLSFNGLEAITLQSSFCDWTSTREDVFDLTKIPLAPGFGIDSFSATNLTPQTEWNNSDSEAHLSPGGFQVHQASTQVVIDYQLLSVYTKASLMIPGSSVCYGGYEIAISVIGPRGVSPLTQ